MSEEDLRRRVQKLEEQVYSNNNNDADKQIGYLKTKLRDLGEALQEAEKNIESLKDDVQRVKGEEELAEKVEKTHRDVANLREQFHDEVDQKTEEIEQLHEAVIERLDGFNEETGKVYSAIDELAEKMNGHVDLIMPFLKFTMNGFVRVSVPDELVHEAQQMIYEGKQVGSREYEVNNAIMNYAALVLHGRDELWNPEMFKAFVVVNVYPAYVSGTMMRAKDNIDKEKMIDADLGATAEVFSESISQDRIDEMFDLIVDEMSKPTEDIELQDRIDTYVKRCNEIKFRTKEERKEVEEDVFERPEVTDIRTEGDWK